MQKSRKRMTIPKFPTEEAEVRWWNRKSKVVENELVAALSSGTAQRLAKEAREAKNITIRMPVAEIERARTLAGRKGIGYQTYMKMLLREALDREARKAG